MEYVSKLARTDTKNRIYYSCLNMTILLMVVSTIVSFSPLALVLLFVAYVFLAFWISAALIAFTIGLIFTVEDNIIIQMWKLMDSFNIDNAVKFQQVASPICLSLLGIFLLITFIGLFSKNRIKKGKEIAVFVIGIIFFFISLAIFILSK